MKTFGLSLLMAFALTGIVQSATDAPSLNWTHDFAAASARAKDEGKLVLLNFTGTDWCVWCHRLRDEVFLTPPFAAYAASDVVLVEVDFPRNKKLPPEVEKQNKELDERYEVSGYPTVILVTPEGRELGRTGYMRGGPKTFIRELRRFSKKAAE